MLLLLILLYGVDAIADADAADSMLSTRKMMDGRMFLITTLVLILDAVGAMNANDVANGLIIIDVAGLVVVVNAADADADIVVAAAVVVNDVVVDYVAC